MDVAAIQTDAYFDGSALHQKGPYLVEIKDGRITAIRRGPALRQRLPLVGGNVLQTAFLMPGLVDGHVHMFLNGRELDFAARKAHLQSDFATMMRLARNNAKRLLAAGVSVVRDAGDRFGVNTALRDALSRDSALPLTIRAAGAGIKRPKRYGGFIARDLDDIAGAGAMVAGIARHSDNLKIILTGIIDFELGKVRGAPQFSVEELTSLVAIARQHGLQTMVHCSGLAGLEVAVAAGVGSIEHGFFMTREILQKMADRQIAWVPTFSPVQFQWQHPGLAGWDQATVGNLRRILDSHHEHVALAGKLGVPLVAGSDAGSYGVDHGLALIDELRQMRTSGLQMQDVLAAATSRPRALWSLSPANISVGNEIDVIGLRASPFHDIKALAKTSFSFKIGTLMLN